MLKAETADIIEAARKDGWVLEPEALRLLQSVGVPVPRFAWARSRPEALAAAETIGYPVVAKVVSPQILHKSEVQGVAPGIPNAERLADIYERFSRLPGFEGVVVAEMLAGHQRAYALASSRQHVIPGHDPLVMKRYPAPSKALEGIVARLDVEPVAG